jgi:hypothetical protein
MFKDKDKLCHMNVVGMFLVCLELGLKTCEI